MKSVGYSSVPLEFERLVHLAHEESLRLYGTMLFDNPNQDIGKITNDGIRVIGPELIFGKIYDRIGYNKIKEPLLRSLAISRITHSFIFNIVTLLLLYFLPKPQISWIELRL